MRTQGEGIKIWSNFAEVLVCVQMTKGDANIKSPGHKVTRIADIKSRHFKQLRKNN